MIGSWILSPDSDNLRILAESKLDFAIIDYEHGVGSLASAARAVSFLQSSGKKVAVRIGEVRKLALQRAADSSPDYIQVAGIDSIGDLERCVDLLSGLGYSPWTRSGFGTHGIPRVILQVENRELLDWVVNGDITSGQVTDLFLGRYDLAKDARHLSLEVDEHYSAIEKFSMGCKQNGISAWTVCHSREDYLKINKLGDFKGVTYGSDALFYSEALKQLEKWGQ
jgi:2-keto-3-deoxy-L-rhamnonate aldolase RhmA